MDTSSESSDTKTAGKQRGIVRSLIRLARVHQWSKGAFVLVGPVFAFTYGEMIDWGAVFFALIAFCLGASGCYVFNDLADVEQDRAHPRKCKRPIACGDVSEAQARVFGWVLLAAAIASAMFTSDAGRWWVVGLLVVYIANVVFYSLVFKGFVILDVLSLSSGFVLRVLGGCAAAMVSPSTWLLNVTLFLSMFLAFGKRLGERRVLEDDAHAVSTRRVQESYSDQLLRIMVTSTGIASLLTYTGYVQSREEQMSIVLAQSGDAVFAFNVLWVSVLPVMYGLFRTITLIMQGRYDDPTELAMRDPWVRASAVLFVASLAGSYVAVNTLAPGSG